MCREIGDIGGAPSDLDATCLKDSMKKNVPGVQDTKSFEITYFFDNSSADSDYRKIKALQTPEMSSPWRSLSPTAPSLPPPVTSPLTPLASRLMS